LAPHKRPHTFFVREKEQDRRERNREGEREKKEGVNKIIHIMGDHKCRNRGVKLLV
jgi:hypothetical protein